MKGKWFWRRVRLWLTPGKQCRRCCLWCKYMKNYCYQEIYGEEQEHEND